MNLYDRCRERLRRRKAAESPHSFCRHGICRFCGISQVDSWLTCFKADLSWCFACKDEEAEVR